MIVDPHIAMNKNYSVYADGVTLQKSYSNEGNFTSIFVKDRLGFDFVGSCWPGDSVWIDFLNENA